MDLKHFSHKHGLIFKEEITSHGSDDDEKAYCSACGDAVSGPSFSCAICRFYLDKKCAEAPKKLNLPFHRKHSFLLRKKHRCRGKCFCDFCKKECEKFVYHCSCGLDFHVKCALFLCNLAEKGVGDQFQHVARIDPLISTGNGNEELKEADCFGCRRPLLDSIYFSPDCGYYLHEKCANLSAEVNHLFHPDHPLILQIIDETFSCKICKQEQRMGFFYKCSLCEYFLHTECATLPTTINHLCHRKHPLHLQFSNEGLPCQICQQTTNEVHAYCCSICNLALHIECVPTPKIVKDKSHQHNFIPFWRSNVSFVCDVCGTHGRFISYICSTCSIMVHKKCTSLPLTLNHPMHFEHPIIHTHLLGQDQDEIEMWECQICHSEEVDAKHARYRCSQCDYNVHVNCAIEDYKWYEFNEFETTDKNFDENSPLLLPYSVIEEIKQGENVIATEIKHFSHEHNLTLSNDIKDDKFCDGCVQWISTSYYNCSECNFSLHKSCAELPMKKRLWFHHHPEPFPLSSGSIFKCDACDFETSGFAYTCRRCCCRFCLRCAIVSPRYHKSEGHEHSLSFYKNYEGSCNACGDSLRVAHRCKRCDLSLDWICIQLPLKARHRSDDHPLMLACRDDNDYSEAHYCDICEEKRNPNLWFYHCATCNTSAHLDCVLDKYRLIKLGSIYKEWLHHHPHPLTFVKKDYYYPKCNICRKPCCHLALECKEMECSSYIVCWECIRPSHFEEEDEAQGKKADEDHKEDEEEEEDDEEEDEDQEGKEQEEEQ